MLFAESRNQRFSNSALPSIGGRDGGRAGDLSRASRAVRMRLHGETIYHFVRNMIVRYVISWHASVVEESRGVDLRRETVGEYGQTDEAVFKTDVPSRATTNAIPHDPPFLFSARLSRGPCVYRTVIVYTYTHSAASPTVTSLLSPSFFSLFFLGRLTLCRAREIRFRTQIARTFFQSSTMSVSTVGYLVDVPCVPRPVVPRCYTISVRRHCCQSPLCCGCGHCCHCRQSPLRRPIRKYIGGSFSIFPITLFISLRITLFLNIIMYNIINV